MPISWCELADAMREQGLEWNRRRPWDPEGRFVPARADPALEEPPAQTVDEALRSLPPWRPEERPTA
jgi:hypothetical protein